MGYPQKNSLQIGILLDMACYSVQIRLASEYRPIPLNEICQYFIEILSVAQRFDGTVPENFEVSELEEIFRKSAPYINSDTIAYFQINFKNYFGMTAFMSELQKRQ